MAIFRVFRVIAVILFGKSIKIIPLVACFMHSSYGKFELLYFSNTVLNWTLQAALLKLSIHSKGILSYLIPQGKIKNKQIIMNLCFIGSICNTLKKFK